MTVAEMNPCPWCHYRPSPVLHSTDGNASVSVVCNHCGARGPLSDNDEAAEAAWDAAGVKVREGQQTVREFTNELGNRIRITIEGPTSASENVLTPMEAAELRSALDAHGVDLPALTDEQVDEEALRWNLPGNDESLAFHRLPHSTQVMRAFKDGLRRGHALAAGVTGTARGQQ